MRGQAQEEKLLLALIKWVLRALFLNLNSSLIILQVVTLFTNQQFNK